MKKLITLIVALFISIALFSQEDDENDKSNIQTYTPSKLLDKGSWDVKWFNNLYTENKFANADGNSVSKARENYFTSTVEIFTGITESSRINVGLILETRSNTIGGRDAFSVFSFDGRAGLTSISPSIKWQPLENVGNFSVQSSLNIPLVEKETVDGIFLDEAVTNFQNRLFYDYTFESGNWQLFSELNTQYFFGKDEVSTFDNLGRKTTTEGSFATDTFILNPGLFLSYFPSDKSTVLGFVQHFNRFGNFTQDYTALGFGGKYQITETLNLEVLYSNFVRGTDNGLGQSFNIGLRYLFTK